MRRWVKWTAVGVGAPVALVAVACAGGQSLKDAAQGTWDCVISDEYGTAEVDVTVGDGTYQVTSEYGMLVQGTWMLQNGTAHIQSSDAMLAADGLPDKPEEAMLLRLDTGGSSGFSPWGVRWKNNTVSFSYEGMDFVCDKNRPIGGG